jgi:hypothetical protein
VQARVAVLLALDLGLKQRLGRQEVIVLTERFVPFEQLVLVHADHASLLVAGWSGRGNGGRVRASMRPGRACEIAGG